MNSIQIGREFEEEAYKFLSDWYGESNVKWLSKKRWSSPVDFEVVIGKPTFVEARKNLNDCRIFNDDIIKNKIFITQVDGEIYMVYGILSTYNKKIRPKKKFHIAANIYFNDKEDDIIVHYSKKWKLSKAETIMRIIREFKETERGKS